jgi:hypothetical protein
MDLPEEMFLLLMHTLLTYRQMRTGAETLGGWQYRLTLVLLLGLRWQEF